MKTTTLDESLPSLLTKCAALPVLGHVGKEPRQPVIVDLELLVE
jgi:hypothetical protein